MSESETDTLMTGVGPDPYPAISQRRRRGVRVTSAAAIALGLVLAGGGAAGAATAASSSTSFNGARPGVLANRPPMGGDTLPVAVGTVQSVGDGTFTITTRSGTTVTVNVGTTTTYLDPGVTTPTIADVTVGEHVAVFGTDTPNTVTATQVAIGTPPKGGTPETGGDGGPAPAWAGPTGP